MLLYDVIDMLFLDYVGSKIIPIPHSLVVVVQVARRVSYCLVEYNNLLKLESISRDRNSYSILVDLYLERFTDRLAYIGGVRASENNKGHPLH